MQITAMRREAYQDVPIIHDEILPAFPELGYRSTYHSSHEIILKRAYQLAHLGVQAGDKIIIYKSSKFDYVSFSYSCCLFRPVPAMISYHFPASTIEVFVDRLEDHLYPFDEETENQWQLSKSSSRTNRLLSQSIVTTS